MIKFKFVPKKKIRELPETSGAYVFVDKNKNGGKGEKNLYIGKAINIKKRVKNHFQRPAGKNVFFINQVSKIGYIETDSEIEALLLEAKLIKKYRPKYNIAWRDDKNYFYVGVTKEPFPRVFVTHQKKSKINYFGPFVGGKKLKKTLEILRKNYPFRTCKILPKKPCLWYHLGQCPAPCLFKSRRIEAYDVSNIQGKNATG